MDKYRLVREQLQDELEASGHATFEVSPLATVEELTTAHCPEYVESFLKGTLEPRHQKRVGAFVQLADTAGRLPRVT